MSETVSDFAEGQWWLRELDAVVAAGTNDQKRAVAVVRNLLRTAHATQAAPTAPTEAMELAGMRALRNTYRTATGEYSREQARACWDAMVAAAQPEPKP